MDIIVLLSDAMEPLAAHDLELYVTDLLHHSKWARYIDDVELNYGCEKQSRMFLKENDSSNV